MITSGQRILTKGRIAVLSPLVQANGFVRLWPHLTHGFLGAPHSVFSQTASRSILPFLQVSRSQSTDRQTDRRLYSVWSKAAIASYRCYVAPNNKCPKIWRKAASQGGGFFTGDDIMWHRPVGSIAIRCSSGAVMPLLIFAAFNATVTLQCFLICQTTPKIAPFPSRILTPSNTWFLGPSQVSPMQTASRSVQPFCRAHERDQQTQTHTHTHKHTDHATLSVAIGRI